MDGSSIKPLTVWQKEHKQAARVIRRYGAEEEEKEISWYFVLAPCLKRGHFGKYYVIRMKEPAKNINQNLF